MAKLSPETKERIEEFLALPRGEFMEKVYSKPPPQEAQTELQRMEDAITRSETITKEDIHALGDVFPTVFRSLRVR